MSFATKLNKITLHVHVLIFVISWKQHNNFMSFNILFFFFLLMLFICDLKAKLVAIQWNPTQCNGYYSHLLIRFS